MQKATKDPTRIADRDLGEGNSKRRPDRKCRLMGSLFGIQKAPNYLSWWCPYLFNPQVSHFWPEIGKQTAQETKGPPGLGLGPTTDGQIHFTNGGDENQPVFTGCSETVVVLLFICDV